MRAIYRLAVAGALLADPAAFAVDLVVTRYDDPPPNGCLTTDCSLREAVVAANSTATADRILLSAGSYLLSIPGDSEEFAATGDLDLRADVEVVGPGATMTFVDGGGLDSVFATPLPVLGAAITMRGLTVRGGAAAFDWAGIHVNGGSLTLEECEVADNGGYGIVANFGANLELRKSTIAENGSRGLLLINTGTAAELENVTISENGQQVSIQTESHLDCNHCTIYDPTNAFDEVQVVSAGSIARFTNSIVHGNCALESDGEIESGGGNLEWAASGDTCSFHQTSDQPDADPQLSGLAYFGGSTRAHLPGSGSDALGAALDASCATQDQRGATRPAAGCDSGAVERGPMAPLTPIFHDGFLQGNTEAWDSFVLNP